MDYDKKNSDYNRLKNYTFIRNEKEDKKDNEQENEDDDY